MVKKIVLYDKIYNFTTEEQKQNLLSRYNKYLHELIGSFPSTHVHIKKLREYDNRVQVVVEGPEENFVTNILKKEVGLAVNLNEVEIGDVYKGTMVDVEEVGFGIFVDCAFLNPKTDLLLNLHTLRRQLANNKKVSVRDIASAYDFTDHFPVYVKILEVNKSTGEVRGKLAQQTLDLYDKFLTENLEGVFMSGETKGQFKKAIVNTGHLRDIVDIVRFGFLEHILILREDTQAPGIISDIGRFLENCKLSAIRPFRIRKLSQ